MDVLFRRGFPPSQPKTRGDQGYARYGPFDFFFKRKLLADVGLNFFGMKQERNATRPWMLVCEFILPYL